MQKLQFHKNKVLKLTNVLEYKILLNTENFDFNIAIEQMQSYIRTKGVTQIGPLIQYTRTYINADNELEVELVLMLQCSDFIHNVEVPFSMKAVIRVPNALYCRYTGPDSCLKFAYDKINLEAFENDIATENCNYTVFLKNDMQDDVMIADVFVPRADAL